MTLESETPIVIYESSDKAVEVRLDTEQETVWLTQRQMAELFGKDVRTVNEHVQNLYDEGELEREATVRDFRIVRQEGARQVSRAIEHYNLDVIISVGYRVKSSQGTRFRQWATRTLREHLTQGWTLNRQRFEANARELEAAMALVRKTAQSPELTTTSGMNTPMGNPDVFPKDLDMELVQQFIPVRPPAEPAMVADLILHVASDRAANIHGACLLSDGGHTAG